MSTEDNTAAMCSALGRWVRGVLSFHKWFSTCVLDNLWTSAASSLHCQPDKWQCLPAGESFMLQLRPPSTASKPSKLQKPATGTTSPSRLAAVQGDLWPYSPPSLQSRSWSPQIASVYKECASRERPVYQSCMLGSPKSCADCKGVLINSALIARVDSIRTCPFSYL